MSHFSLEQLLKSFAEKRGIVLPPESLACLRDADSQLRPWLLLAPVSKSAARQIIHWLCFICVVLLLSQKLRGSAARAFAGDLLALIRYAVQNGLLVTTWSESDFFDHTNELLESIVEQQEYELADRLAWLYSVDFYPIKVSRLLNLRKVKRLFNGLAKLLFGWLF